MSKREPLTNEERAELRLLMKRCLAGDDTAAHPLVVLSLLDERDRLAQENDRIRMAAIRDLQREHLKRTPPGTRIGYILRDYVMILGIPDEPEPGSDESTWHNCDAMGCGSLDHVVERYKIVRVP